MSYTKPINRIADSPIFFSSTDIQWFIRNHQPGEHEGNRGDLFGKQERQRRALALHERLGSPPDGLPDSFEILGYHRELSIEMFLDSFVTELLALQIEFFKDGGVFYGYRIAVNRFQ